MINTNDNGATSKRATATDNTRNWKATSHLSWWLKRRVLSHSYS